VEHCEAVSLLHDEKIENAAQKQNMLEEVSLNLQQVPMSLMCNLQHATRLCDLNNYY
jgi:hypothetical protein